MSYGYDYSNKKWRAARLTRHGAMFAEIAALGYVEGRQFKSFYDFSLTTAQEVVFKFVSPVDFEIISEWASITEGEIEIKVYKGGTPSGTFNSAAPVIGQNLSTERPLPYYESLVTLASGGTHTGGTQLETVRVKSANATAFQSSVGALGIEKWFFPADSYYIHIKCITASKGVYNLRWEERLVTAPL